MWEILYSKKEYYKVLNKSCLKNLIFKELYFLKNKWMYTNSLGQYFDKVSLNAASCQTADSTDSVLIPVEPELKYLKTTSS